MVPTHADVQTGRWWRQPRLAFLVVAVALLPLAASLPTIRDPFGQTEESVNAAIWAVGARHIRDDGWIKSKFGAVYTPLYPWANGVYAHHPPLPVWLSRVWLLFGNAEFIPRVFALLLAAVTLLLLFDSLTIYVPYDLALWAMAATATTGYMIRYGRLFTTLTIATPLFVLGLRTVLQRLHRGQPWRFSLFLVVPLLVASSWDGVVGAGTLCAALLVHEAANAWHLKKPTPALAQALALAMVGVAALVLLAWYFVNASGSLGELLRQASVRSGGNDLPFPDWARAQLDFLQEGLGLLGLVLLAATPLLLLLHLRTAPLASAIALSSTPGAVMLLLMREGAAAHRFWAYNLVLPFAFSVAQALLWLATRSWAQAALRAGLLVQAVVNVEAGGAMLQEERHLNALGALVKNYYRAHPVDRVLVYGAYDFHPYIAWYLKVPHDVIYSMRDLSDRLERNDQLSDLPMLVDTLYLGYRPCHVLATAANGRWVIARAQDTAASCGPPN